MTHPLLSFGRLLKQGWTLGQDQQDLPGASREGDKNSSAPRKELVGVGVKVCAVRADCADGQEAEGKSSTKRKSEGKKLKREEKEKSMKPTEQADDEEQQKRGHVGIDAGLVNRDGEGRS